FTGFRAHAQGGITDRGDNENYEVGFSAGFDVGERGHVLLSAEKFHQNSVFTYEGRDWYQSWGTVTAPTDPTRQLVRPNVISTRMSLDGIVLSDHPALSNLQFFDDGSVGPLVYGNPAALPLNTTQSHVTASRSGGTDNAADYPNLQPESGRESVFAYVDFDVTDNLNVYAQGIYGRSQVLSSNFGGIFGSVSSLTIFADN